MRKLEWVLSAAALVAALAVAAWPSTAADHLDSPLVKKDGRTDITDIYAFRSLENSANTVLIMNVNPLAGVLSGTTFDPDGTYQFNIDNDHDAVADLVLETTFSKPGPDGAQTFKIRLADVKPGSDEGDELNVKAKAKGSTGSTAALGDQGHVWAGLADDPFFFDLQAFRDQVKGAGGSRTFCDSGTVDFFAGSNVTSIVVEVPSNALTRGTDPNIGVWGRTYHKRTLIDQMARPAINTVFVPDDMKDAFNAADPTAMPGAFGSIFQADLLALSGLDGTPYSADQAATITGILLPDVLTLDTSSSLSFLNGRKPTDDVIDTELFIVTGGLFGGSAVLASDCIPSNEVTLPSVSPYLAAPH